MGCDRCKTRRATPFLVAGCRALFRGCRLLTVIALCGLTAGAWAQEADDTTEWRKPIPLSLTLDYSLWSDFVCRKSINLSEYPGEGREDLNHQIWAAAAVSSKDVLGLDIGTFSIGYWADWFEGQEGITPNHDGTQNEWDIIASWTYGIPKTPFTFSLSYDYWVLPPYDEGGASHDSFSGHELWFGLAFDDSVLFGRPIFSPYVLWVRDIDDFQENWIDIGVSHTFVLSSLGCADIPVLRHVSVTPKVVVGIDDGYVDAVMGQDRGTHLASINYSLTVGYNLGSAIGMPRKYGTLSTRAFIHYKDQTHDYNSAGFYPVLRDEVYGGVGITYGW